MSGITPSPPLCAFCRNVDKLFKLQWCYGCWRDHCRRCMLYRRPEWYEVLCFWAAIDHWKGTFYSILFIIFYSIILYSFLFYFILLCSILFFYILLNYILLQFILFYSILLFSILIYCFLLFSILFRSNLFNFIPFYSIHLYFILLYSI